MATSIKGILRVLFVSSRHKVSGIYATAIVTGVSQQQAVWNRAVRQLIRNPVSANGSFANADAAVSGLQH